jgi:hypothetical protein
MLSRCLHIKSNLLSLGAAVLVLATLCVPSYADKLQGYIQFHEPVLLEQYPTSDTLVEVNWNAWLRRICNEVTTRINATAKKDHYPLAGKLTVKCVVHRDGAVDVDVIADESTNLGLLVPNVIQSLHNSPLLQFPSPSQREFVAWTAVCQCASDAEMDVPQTSSVVENKTLVSR